MNFHESLGKFTSHSLGRKMVSQLAPHDMYMSCGIDGMALRDRFNLRVLFFPSIGERQEKTIQSHERIKKKRGLNGGTTIRESRNDQPKFSGKIPKKTFTSSLIPPKWVIPSNFTNPHAGNPSWTLMFMGSPY